MNSMLFFAVFFHSLGCLEEDSNERQSMEHSSVDEVEREIQESTLSVQIINQHLRDTNGLN